MVDGIIEALRRVTRARLFDTERGFQGALHVNLEAVLGGALPSEAIIEQEHQKRIRSHGIKLRPDIIIHVPTLTGGDHTDRNFAVLALKRRATRTMAQRDFEALDEMFEQLHYPFGAFINIGSDRNHAERYRGRFPERMHFFAVWQGDGRTHVSHTRVPKRNANE